MKFRAYCHNCAHLGANAICVQCGPHPTAMHPSHFKVAVEERPELTESEPGEPLSKVLDSLLDEEDLEVEEVEVDPFDDPTKDIRTLAIRELTAAVRELTAAVNLLCYEFRRK